MQIVPLIPARRAGVADDSAPLTVLAPYPPSCKYARPARQPVTFANMDNCSRWVSDDVEFLVVRRCRSAVSRLVLFLVVGHLLPWRVQQPTH